MTGDDLIVAAPWLAFAAGLAVIGWRLAAGRGRRRRDAAGLSRRRTPGTGRTRPVTGTPEGRSVAQNGWRRDR